MTTGVDTPCALSSSRSASPSLPGITTSESIKSKDCDLASSRALFALSQTAASCPSKRNARDSEASVLASSSTISKCAFCATVFSCPDFLSRSGLPRLWFARQFDPKNGSFFFRARDANFTAVITYHRLHNRQPESRAMLLSRVIRSEQASALFLGQTGAGIGDRNFNVIAESRGANHQLSALRHGIDRVEHQVLQRAMQQIGIG